MSRRLVWLEEYGKKIQREVWALDEDDGLVITEGLGECGLWVITHAASGHRVGGFVWPFLCDAREFMDAILPFADWTKPIADLDLEKLKPLVLAEAKRIQAARD